MKTRLFEIFTSIEGEGILYGTKTLFVRFAGCPYSCFYYCVYPLQQGRKVRFKSPKRLFEEMKHFNQVLKVSNFIFRDSIDKIGLFAKA